MNRENTLGDTFALIESRLQEQLRTEDLAGSVFLSKYHYGRIFRAAVGEGVMHYVKRRRLEAAAHALLTTGVTVLEVALQAGYSTHESFTRAFRAFMGVTPSAYRRYAFLSEKPPYERKKQTMKTQYISSREEISRKSSQLIATAYSAIEISEKCGVPEYRIFWELLGKKAAAFTKALQDAMGACGDLPLHPEKISEIFTLVKALEDVRFYANIAACSARIMVARGTPEHRRQQEEICASYEALATVAVQNTNAVVSLLFTLGNLICADMRQQAEECRSTLLAACRRAMDTAGEGTSIAREVGIIETDLASIPVEKLSAPRLEGFSLRLDILSFYADAELCRYPDRRAGHEALSDLCAHMREAQELLGEMTLIDIPAPVYTLEKRLEDIGLQQNILFFFTYSELAEDKLGKLLTKEQRAAFASLLAKIEETIGLTHGLPPETASLNRLSGVLQEITEALQAQAEALGDLGSPLLYLASQYRFFSEACAR